MKQLINNSLILIKKFWARIVGREARRNTKVILMQLKQSHNDLLKVSRKCYGFNAIELSLVLAVIAIAIVATIRVMAGNTDKQNSNQMVHDVSMLVSNIKNAFSSSQGGYMSLNTEIAIKARVVPLDLKHNDSEIQNQFQGGKVVITHDDTGENFTVEYTNVPSAICNSAVNTLGSASFLSIKINDKDVFDVDTTPLDAATVAEACSANKDKSKIDFKAS